MKWATAQTEQKNQEKSLKIRYFGLKLCDKQPLCFGLGYFQALILQGEFRSCLEFVTCGVELLYYSCTDIPADQGS